MVRNSAQVMPGMYGIKIIIVLLCELCRGGVINQSSGISIIGSLNPQKEVQDRVRVLSTGGGMSITSSHRL